MKTLLKVLGYAVLIYLALALLYPIYCVVNHVPHDSK
jgi:hypothetical protein